MTTKRAREATALYIEKESLLAEAHRREQSHGFARKPAGRRRSAMCDIDVRERDKNDRDREKRIQIK